MTFITLTRTDGIPVVINFEQVTAFSSHGEHTTVFILTDDPWRVNETVPEVIAALERAGLKAK